MSPQPPTQQRRARSPEAKAKKMEDILDVGQKLFLRLGPKKFSLRGLAKELKMNPNNLYNYVSSKRELWIAIRNRFYTDYKHRVRAIAKNHHGTNIDLIYKIFEFFLEYAGEDFQRFQFMHLSEPPPPSINMESGLPEIGPVEQAYRPFNLLTHTNAILQKAVHAGEIPDQDTPMLTAAIFGAVIGWARMENDIRSNEEGAAESQIHVEKIRENLELAEIPFTAKEFRSFALEKLKEMPFRHSQ